MIFVFGSNLKGIHGAGAALHALRNYGAQMGAGEGWYGSSYALPTCSEPGVPLPLEEIKRHVDKFMAWAYRGWVLTGIDGPPLVVTRVGCGLAGYTDAQIAPMFVYAPDNVWLPSAWVRAIAEDVGGEAIETMYPPDDDEPTRGLGAVAGDLTP